MHRMTPRIALLAAIALAPVASHASIISTAVNASITIEQRSPTPAIASDTDSGVLSALASVAGPSGSSGSVALQFDALGAESANLDFDITWDGGTIQNGIMTAPSLATITYGAVVDSTLEFAWDFAYLGPNPFGLQVVRIEEGGTALQVLGDFGQIGTHTGSDTFSLVAGTTYTFGVRFDPSVSGGVGTLAGSLLGDVSFQFNGAAVPEPSTLALASLLALAGAAGARRRRTQG